MSDSESEHSASDQQNNNQANGSVEPKQNDTFSLYIRSSAWIKDRDESAIKLKEIDNRIIKVRYPRQKSAHYCFIDFASAADRDSAYKDLMKRDDVYVKAMTRDNVKLVQKKAEEIQNRRKAKQEMRKLMKSTAKSQKVEKPLSNQILLLQMSREATKTEIKKFFPSAIEINIRQPKEKKHLKNAIVSFATPAEAVRAVKGEFELHGVKFKVRLMAQKKRPAKKTVRQATA